MRQSIADLLSQETLQHLAQSEDIPVICGLLSRVRHDWPGASTTLEKLITLKVHAGQAVT
jgi:hypothetical protein